LKAALLALLLAAPAAAAEDYTLPPPPSTGTHVDYSADRAEFDAEHSTLHLSGDVIVKETTMTVKGQDLWIDTARRTGRSDGPLLVDDGVSAVYGDGGEFDFGHHTGRLFHSSAGIADWRIHARESNLGDDKRLEYRSADFTSCNHVPPHYHFHASKVVVVPKKHLLATNVLFYLGDVPVFYTPILYEQLTPTHFFGWKTQPGFDRRNGVFAKDTLTTQYSTSTYSKLFADYYSKQGFGYGGELERHLGTDSRGALYGYRIHETSTGLDRYGLFGQGFQALPSSSAFQARFQFQSDPNFNNDYNRSSTFRVTPDLTDNAAYVHRFSNGTARLSYQRFDVANAAGNGFTKSTEDAPRLEYQSTPLRLLNLPWLNTFSGFADNNYDMTRPFLQKSVNGAWEGTRVFRLTKGVSFTPKLDFSETYYNKFTELSVDQGSTTVYDGIYARWIAAGDLRYNSPFGRIDLGEAYSQRLKPDAFTQDTGNVDKGVEQNLATVSDLFLPFPRVWAQVSTGYDFRTFRDHSVGFRDRVQPLVTQTNWQATKRLDLSFRDDYQLNQGNRAIIADARWGDEYGPSLGGGFAYNISDPGNYYANTEFAIAPFETEKSTPTWKVAFVFRALVASDGGVQRAHGLRLFEKEVDWTKRWHDFYTKVGYRARPGGVGEVTARVDFKFGTTDPKQAPHRDWESEWFPERANGQDDMRP
jgi:LPS-assembly protein